MSTTGHDSATCFSRPAKKSVLVPTSRAALACKHVYPNDFVEAAAAEYLGTEIGLINIDPDVWEWKASLEARRGAK